MFALFCAFVLDLLIGDPVYRFHPVRIMGQAIAGSESVLRARIKSAKLAGAILALSFPWIVFILV
jgi:adenosylcobinamide-phosphate synthase